MKGLSKTPPPPPEPCLKEGPTPQLLREPRRAQPTCSPREWVAGWRGRRRLDRGRARPAPPRGSGASLSSEAARSSALQASLRAGSLRPAGPPFVPAHGLRQPPGEAAGGAPRRCLVHQHHLGAVRGPGVARKTENCAPGPPRSPRGLAQVAAPALASTPMGSPAA